MALVSVPTFFTVIPGWTRWNGLWRALVLLIWVGIALGVLYTQVEHGEKVAALSEKTRRQREHLRRAATAEVLRALLSPGIAGLRAGYSFTVYMPDGNELRPIFPSVQLRPGETDLRVFAVGDGATGSAWKVRATFVVTGDMVHSDRHGLTIEQQEHFAPYNSVAATPIYDPDGVPIGVLTAISKDDDRCFDDAGGGRFTLERLAEIVGVVLKSIPEEADFDVSPPSVK